MNTQKTSIRFHTMLLLLMIIAFGAMLRFLGIAYDLPYAFNPDEAYIMDRAVAVADANLRHGVIFRGSLPYYITGATIKLVSVAYPNLQQGYPTLREAYVHDKTLFYIIGRSIVAMYSILTMVVLFYLACSIFSNTVALLSILLFDVASLDIQFSHEIYPDTGLSFILVSTTYLLLLAYRRKGTILFYICAFLVGIAAAQKLPGILLLPFLLIIFHSHLQRIGKSFVSQLPRFFIIIGIVILIYLLSYPFIFSELSSLRTKWYDDTGPNFDQLIILEASIAEKLRDYLMWLRDGMGTSTIILSAIGCFVALRKRLAFTKSIVGFMLFYLFMIVLGKPHYDNYLIPLIPFISLFAAVGLSTFTRRIGIWTQSKVFSYLVGIVLVWPTFLQAVWIAHSYTVPDTRLKEVQWFRDNGVKESQVARDGYTSVGIPARNILTNKLTLEQLQTFNYIVLSSSYSPNFSNPKRNVPELAEHYAAIQRSYSKVAEFRSDDYVSHPDVYTELVKWKVYTRPVIYRGPTITIYKVHPM